MKSEKINHWRRGCFRGPFSSSFLNFAKAARTIAPKRGGNQANRVPLYLSFSRNSTDHFLNGWPVEPFLGGDSSLNVIVPMSFRDLNEVSERAMYRSEGKAFQQREQQMQREAILSKFFYFTQPLIQPISTIHSIIQEPTEAITILCHYVDF